MLPFFSMKQVLYSCFYIISFRENSQNDKIKRIGSFSFLRMSWERGTDFSKKLFISGELY